MKMGNCCTSPHGIYTIKQAHQICTHSYLGTYAVYMVLYNLYQMQVLDNSIIRDLYSTEQQRMHATSPLIKL